MNYKVAYAFLESHLSKSKKNIIDIYSDMILLFSGNNNNTKKILEKVNKETWIEIPYEVSKTLLKNLRKKWYIEYKEFEKYTLTENGDKYKIKSTKDYENEWFDDIENDLKNLKIATSLKEIIEMFLKSDITKVDFAVDEWLKLESNKDVLNKFFKYLSDTKKKNIEKYNKIIWLLYTWLLWKLLLQRDIDWISDSFNWFEVYLDTNIIISLLWYHEESVNLMTQEIVDKLKTMNAKLYISSLTLNELNNLLYNYQPEKYLNEYPIDNIYYNMKLQKLSKSDINIVIENIEIFLEKQWIQINYMIQEKILKEDHSFLEKINSLSQYKKKGNYSQKTIEHDVLMQIFINKQRHSLHSTYAQSIDKSKIIFLTLDSHLASRNLTNKKNWATPEILYIESIATYLWLKNPNIDNISEVRLFLNWNFKKQVISNNLWESFLFELSKKVDSKEISQEDCDTLLSMESTKSSLFELEKDIEKTWKADFSKILSEESIQKIHWEKNSTKRKMEWLYLANKTIKKKQEDAEWQLLIINNNIQKDAEKKARLRIILIKIVTICLIWLISFPIFSLFNWRISKNSTRVSFMITIIFGIMCFNVEIIWKLFNPLYNKIVINIVKRKKRKLFKNDNQSNNATN